MNDTMDVSKIHRSYLDGKRLQMVEQILDYEHGLGCFFAELRLHLANTYPNNTDRQYLHFSQIVCLYHQMA